MSSQANKIILWTPRILTILFAAFLMLFSFDVFGPGQKWWYMALGFLVHNIPVILVLIVLFFSWKRPLIGGFIFTLAGVLLLVRMLVDLGSNGWLGDSWYQLILAGPALLIGILFLINSKIKRH